MTTIVLYFYLSASSAIEVTDDLQKACLEGKSKTVTQLTIKQSDIQIYSPTNLNVIPAVYQYNGYVQPIPSPSVEKQVLKCVKGEVYHLEEIK